MDGWTIVASSLKLFLKQASFNNGGLEGALLKGILDGVEEDILEIETAPLEGWNQYIFTEGED